MGMRRPQQEKNIGLVKALQDYWRDCLRDSLSSWRFSTKIYTSWP